MNSRHSISAFRGILFGLIAALLSGVTVSLVLIQPAAAEPIPEGLLVNPGNVRTQANVGLVIPAVLWQETATTRFNTYVEQHAFGPVDVVSDGVAHFSSQDGGQKIHVAAINLISSRGVQVSPADHQGIVGTFASGIGAAVAVNGNWYAPWDGPAVSNGQIYGGQDHSYTALFGLTADKEVVAEHHTAVRDSVDPLIVNGVSGHPTLVHEGQPQDILPDPTFTGRHPRTIIGEAGPRGILLMVTIDGRQPGAAGMTGDESRDLMIGLGAQKAVMLDGGGSTTMWITGRGIVNSPSEPPRQVANEIAVFGA